ncbi:molybdopterin molybdotransferase MoeA [Cellulomonas cellasea]|uniref:molybdopterin molybdotransferase MoeA n=1 Tax=Cellulomonas cellasea TaxID=43670 RepID=UPI0025A436F9|nr:gephyrin-like molybdotransferase Glp [Cellulomonas cellasea]MDM8084619.1 molybdopterin molybdotransferase MoeA [Cellulomonas cellasea]
MPTHEGPRTVADHLAEVLALVAALPPVSVPLDDALGLVLAQDVTAPEALPRFANSAMDGYAVRAHDVAGASVEHPVTLPVVLDLPAGADAQTAIAPGTAARIMTGAPVPPGADAIVPVEATDAGVQTVVITAPATLGAHVRRAGEDVAAGAVVLAAGEELTPYRIAAIASVGRAEVLAHRRPRVLLMSTGSELVVPGEAMRHGQIPDSNSYLLAAAARAAGASVVRLGAVPDDADALRAALGADRPEVDLVITSGGVSQGAYDVVKEVLIGLPQMRFVPVAMQPGKPQGLGRLEDGTPVLALPGNPVSAFVSFEAFGRPALLALRGLTGAALHRPRVRARVTEGWSSPRGREQHIPVVLTEGEHGLEARPAANRGSGSHLVASLALADGLAIVPRDVTAVGVGDEVAVVRIAP